MAESTPPPAMPGDFIRDEVARELASGKRSRILTRFPPEPNGYLHIGHAKSICLNFGIALENRGICNLRMDDTNPTREDTEYVDSIRNDVDWLVAGWADQILGLKEAGSVTGEGLTRATATGRRLEPFFASDYFEALFEFAIRLIESGHAYVCDLSAEQLIELRGSPDRPGRPSPYRDRSVSENLDLFRRMRAAEFPDGAKTLRAKIDMTSPNIHLRDPALYRIRHAEHHRTGAAWCIYPMYDYAHCVSDYIEGITHSICTLEFEVHRPLYDWLLQTLSLPKALPRQIEFARLNLGYTVLSKRKLLQLVQEGLVEGWDDPRMPTISGLRRRGYTPQAIRQFAVNIGVTKFNGLTDVAVLEHAIREDLNRRAQRRMAVLHPLKVVLTNIPPGETIQCQATNNPEDELAGTRAVDLTREIFIEREDFMESPPPKYFRLKPQGEARLKYACIITCDEAIKDSVGNVVEIRATAQLDTRSGQPNSGKKVKGTIHWVSASKSSAATVRLYDRLFSAESPEADGKDFKASLNPDSLVTLTARVEPALGTARTGEHFQFERLGYFCPDRTSTPGHPVFNRTITLKDAWAKENARAVS